MSSTPAPNESKVPNDCPGVTSSSAGTSDLCQGCPNQKFCSSGKAGVDDPYVDIVADKLKHLKSIILVMSGKGGVGKSTVSMCLANYLAKDKSQSVGLLDSDICGPSIAGMTSTLGQSVFQSGTGWSPIFVDENLCTMSSAYLVPTADHAIVWRGSKKTNLIKRFLVDVDWSGIDMLVIDTPPGTSDEHLTLVQLLKKLSHVLKCVIVSTPDIYSIADVRRQINFCNKIHLNICGIVENMNLFQCSDCSTSFEIFPSYEGGIKSLAEEESLEFLGSLNFSSDLRKCSDEGKNLFDESNNCKIDEINNLFNNIKNAIQI